MQPKDLTAIILAGGKGTRMKGWDEPKCLHPVNGVSMLRRITENLYGQGVRRVVVCIGYHGAGVRAAVDSWVRHFDDGLEFSDAGEDATMNERINRALHQIWFPVHRSCRSNVLICYGDEMADVDLKKLCKASVGSSATVTCYRQKLPFGEVYRVGEFLERIQEPGYALVNIGYTILEPGAVSLVPIKPGGFSEYVNQLNQRLRVRVYEHKGKRVTINEPADVAKAEEVWK